MDAEAPVSCGHRLWPSRLVYVSLRDGLSSERGKLKLCRSCFADYWASLETSSVDGSDCAAAFRARPHSCDYSADCAEEVNDWIFFVTAYPDGKARVDRAGRLCETHLAQARQDLFCGT